MNKGAVFIHGLHKVAKLLFVDHSKSTVEQGLSKPFLWGRTNYICAVKRASYFSPDKRGDKGNLLSVEVDGRGFLRILFLIFLLHIWPSHFLPHNLIHDTCLINTTEARSLRWAKAKGTWWHAAKGSHLLSSWVHISLFPVYTSLTGCKGKLLRCLSCLLCFTSVVLPCWFSAEVLE